MLCRMEINSFKFAVHFGAFNPDELLEEIKNGEESAPDILVFPFNTLPEIDLTGKTSDAIHRFSELCKLSAASQGTVFCGVQTRVQEEKFIGTAVFHKGNLIDIVNRTRNILSDAFIETDKIKVFSLKAGRIGLLVDTDCLLAEHWVYLVPACEVILCINRGNSAGACEIVRDFSREFSAPKTANGDSPGLPLFPYLYVDEAGAEWAGDE